MCMCVFLCVFVRCGEEDRDVKEEVIIFFCLSVEGRIRR